MSANQDPSASPAYDGDTPPGEGSMSETLGGRDEPNTGPVSGNRTPMMITLSILALIVVMTAVLIGASFIAS